MYISRNITQNGYSYSICESYFEAPFYRSRKLLDLGPDPERFITYYSEVAFSINLEEELAKCGRKTNQFELEELFLRFLKPEAQRWVNFSLNRKLSSKRISQKHYELEELHWFDRIRLIVLKLDHREPQRVVNRKFPFFVNLLEKSRDEIENYLWDLEDKLNFREKSRYIQAIFGLQYASTLEERDRIFLEGLCSIAQDPKYFMDLSADNVLSRYLSRYVWFYFDSLPIRRVPRIYQNLEMALYNEVAQALQLSLETLLNLSKKEILRIFRQKLLKLHPDKGGSHEEFIRIRKLMEDFLKIRY